MSCILVVDDERPMLRALGAHLRARGYEVDLVESGEAALSRAATSVHDAAIVDLGLPGIDGIEVVHGLRGWTSIPIIVLSARHQEAMKILAFDAGADDYVTKPFSVDELLARLRAVMRRSPGGQDPVIDVGDLRVDVAARLVTVAGKRVKLSPHEFDLLRVLAQNRGKLLTHRTLLR